jgi:CBS domain-containing protein
MKRETVFRGLTAGDVLQRGALVLKQEMRVDRAAHLLLMRRQGAAPVADDSGQCVGVLSVVDVLRWNLDGRPIAPNHLEPNACVWCEWQMVDVKSVGRYDVVQCMMRDPVLVRPDTRLVEIAKLLTDPQRRPVVVVDEKRRPLGVLSSKDVLAALTFAERQADGDAYWSSGGQKVGSNNGKVLAEVAHAR